MKGHRREQWEVHGEQRPLPAVRRLRRPPRARAGGRRLVRRRHGLLRLATGAADLRSAGDTGRSGVRLPVDECRRPLRHVQKTRPAAEDLSTWRFVRDRTATTSVLLPQVGDTTGTTGVPAISRDGCKVAYWKGIRTGTSDSGLPINEFRPVVWDRCADPGGTNPGASVVDVNGAVRVNRRATGGRSPSPRRRLRRRGQRPERQRRRHGRAHRHVDQHPGADARVPAPTSPTRWTSPTTARSSPSRCWSSTRSEESSIPRCGVGDPAPRPCRSPCPRSTGPPSPSAWNRRCLPTGRSWPSSRPPIWPATAPSSSSCGCATWPPARSNWSPTPPGS